MQFDSNAKDLKKAVVDAAESGVKSIADEMNRDFDKMASRLEGRPLKEIKEELVRYFANRGGDVSEPELTEYSEVLQEGGRITFEYGGLKD